ncbi:PAS domain-containing protein [Cohnella ginsengisoli]|uniref:PAS domain-containing protein n=1 Tax=Cohnella ginsengisoli TaxID=425004 RepID=A0A9X4KNR9_9BACL|nr:histidine kinase N-terminal 7TM domain-containing protein [Cohnella ginsengisoli]MDG0795196.1 PAS domain-containing protein [Cohnella ginsengisoli]
MGTPYSAILTLIITAGVINVLMGIYALSGRSKVSMVKTFVAFSLMSAIYTFGSALELAAGSLEEIVLWIKIQYLGMPFLPPLNLLLIMYFLGMEKYLKRSLRISLFIVPAITLILVMTNEAHHLYYRDIVLRPDTLTPKADLVAGPWYLIAGAYTFGCMIGGVVLLLVQWRRKKTYRFQLVTLLIGLLLPLVGDFFYLGGVTPDGVDPIPVIMTVTSAAYMWALASRGLFHVVPIARDNLFESMRDGVLVLDMEDRLVDYNAAAAAIIPELVAPDIGHRLDRLWRLHTDAALLSRYGGERSAGQGFGRCGYPGDPVEGGGPVVPLPGTYVGRAQPRRSGGGQAHRPDRYHAAGAAAGAAPADGLLRRLDGRLQPGAIHEPGHVDADRGRERRRAAGRHSFRYRPLQAH